MQLGYFNDVATGSVKATTLAARYDVDKPIGRGRFGVAWLVREKPRGPAKGSSDVVDSAGGRRGRGTSRSPDRHGGTLSSSRSRSSSAKRDASGTVEPKKYVAKELVLPQLHGADAEGAQRMRELATREIQVLRRLRHPHIVRYVDHVREPDRVFIVMEHCPRGDLESAIKRHREEQRPFSERQVHFMFRQLLEALAELQRNRIVHRDIKAANVFVSKHGNLKLGDFGLVRNGVGSMDVASTYCGTPMYHCPELVQCKLSSQKYTNKSDVWALGMVFYEILALRHPFDGLSITEVFRRVQALEIPPLPPAATKQYDHELIRMVMECMLVPQGRRLSPDVLLQLPVMQKAIPDDDRSAVSPEPGSPVGTQRPREQRRAQIAPKVFVVDDEAIARRSEAAEALLAALRASRAYTQTRSNDPGRREKLEWCDAAAALVDMYGGAQPPSDTERGVSERVEDAVTVFNALGNLGSADLFSHVYQLLGLGGA